MRRRIDCNYAWLGARQTHITLAAAVVLMLSGCMENEPTAAESEVEVTGLVDHLYSTIEDVQTLSFAMRFVEPDTENGASLQEILGGMLSLKLLDLTQFLPATEDRRVIGLACRVLEKATEDIFIATNSCSETDLCDRSYKLAQYCVAEGFASEDDIVIPGRE